MCSLSNLVVHIPTFHCYNNNSNETTQLNHHHHHQKPQHSNWSYLTRLIGVGGNRIRKVSSHNHPSHVLGELSEPMASSVRSPANEVPLSPISFLERSAKVYRDRTSLVHGSIKYTWQETHERCLRLASALAHLGISPGDVVATLVPNIPAAHELHFAIPMAGAVICPLNTRHNAALLSSLLRHSDAKIIFVDHHLRETAHDALNLLENTEHKPLLILISESANNCEYEKLLATGQTNFIIRRPKSEFDPISLNYTSGTTSRPKGVILSHRGAYLNSIATFLLHGMGSTPPVYLCTVPMFHCNGWCLVWGVAALGGSSICLRRVSPKDIFDKIALHKVTHMGGAPTVLNMIANSPEEDRRPLPHKVEVLTGGAPPPPSVLLKMEELGFGVTHMYGLTETYGPGTYCVLKPEWDSLPLEKRVEMKARQGVNHLCLEEVDVKDPTTMKSVPADGKTIGEVMFRGNTLMSGYLKDPEGTREAFEGGWFHSGDLAVKHPDGYIEVKDRSKDIIISGGENISSIEVETVLYAHPAVLEAAVVPRPDDHWGQTPCAFVKLKEGFMVDAEEMISYCRERLPHYMAPKTVIFYDLPRTTTGKVQKFVLRDKAEALGSLS